MNDNFKPDKMFEFDVIVVGGGHAGCEAALAAAKLGAKTLLTSLNLENLATMPCNPAIGGPAKSNLVREIDALGGVMGIATDATYLQMKMLNKSKGPAVRALRAQSDKKEYMKYMRNLLEKQENLFLKQCTVVDLMVKDDKICGAVDELGHQYKANAVILTTGTSLCGKIYIGLQSFPAGRLGEMPAIGLSAALEKLGFTVKKLKTGTPARVDARTIDYSKMTIQPGDEELNFFSFEPDRPIREQMPCYLTRTTKETHDIILKNLDRSPLYGGLIQGIGPRYCPSIEDKVVRFSHRDSHQVFIEPEGRDTYETYVQGFSTSLPADVQVKKLRTLPGMENVWILKPAYAVEYDYLPAVQLTHSLMTKKLEGLFCAGQINGTSGYEEAAAQGLIAGINAVKLIEKKKMIILSRSSSYIGTLIDDLVTKDIEEPYRMLTSRSEYRLILRQENADLRLTPTGYKIGLINHERWLRFKQKQRTIRHEIQRFKETRVKPDENINGILANYGEEIKMSYSLADLMKRPNLNYEAIAKIDETTGNSSFSREICENIEVELKYTGYIERQSAQIEQADRLEKIKIPVDIDYQAIKQLSQESRDRLSKIRPENLAQASRIGGVNPADISLLVVILESKRREFLGNK
ncbi:MAG TPA: tRNA uridine-5-carboxymethylaminomethyl(34) synthesis enzyme MnmG [Candidatus Gastranaerophilales bacterium]|nr:tRNA uridine-5-carboxymethylaminomethyl(34) synthesis enzyme MnmG [Candidatus Gastranaerophilales bacterium]